MHADSTQLWLPVARRKVNFNKKACYNITRGVTNHISDLKYINFMVI
jgi:hypothetical protein